MRILIHGINYQPELTGIGKYTGEMANWLADQGHDVTVITAHPYYPEWEVHDAYKGKLWFTEKLKGVRVRRCPLFVPKKINSINRIIHELSFTLSTLPYWLKVMFERKYDLVICVSPPFYLALIPLLYSAVRNSRLLIHVQDLQIDAAKQLNMIKNKTALNIMFKLEKFLYKRSSAVSAVSQGMISKISQKGIPTAKLLMFPNWVDEDFVRPLSPELSLRDEFGIEQQKKVILYSGNLGEKQGLEVIIKMAEIFQSDTNVLFVIVGSGGAKNNLVNLATSSNLTNIKFFPLQPYEKLSELLAIADVHLVLQKGSASDLVMPSKFTAIMAAGGCVIVTAAPGTSLHQVVQENSLGIVVGPDSDSELARGIKLALSSDLSIYKSNARKYANRSLSKTSILRDFEKAIFPPNRTMHQ
ncbi:WcaI family glycosyltransferase [Dyadobacter sp. Leaf189]|uniref:WcaI family glycosyltransferase n=1 Tax=Dyadobacter sp. Leaf189 TaxID=1736295 RepID=UPI0006FC120A|nr:WcaI family glycosyltransferase [Dyadobacter sp. Leaf189]KQS30701.1 glycosyl transferase family 1 [Dyadobacter sp. Leaf189]